jgi:hypothetical protein
VDPITSTGGSASSGGLAAAVGVGADGVFNWAGVGVGGDCVFTWARASRGSKKTSKASVAARFI